MASDKANVVVSSDSERAVARPTEELKQKALRTLSDLPPFSAILNRLLASLAGENVSFSKLGDLIEKDTVIAGNLLHLVNSALYARRGTVTSVRHALSLLGIEKVRNAILGMSITRMWRKVPMPASWSMARFNLHSASVAVLADLVAQRVPVVYPEGAFIAGLLHDMGRLVIAHGLPQEFTRIETLRTEDRSRLDCETEVLGFTHPEISAEALERWNLPEPIRTAVRNHHQPETADPAPRQMPLSRVIEIANNYVNSIGTSIDTRQDAACSDPALIETIGLDDGLDRLFSEFKAESAAMAVFFR